MAGVKLENIFGKLGLVHKATRVSWTMEQDFSAHSDACGLLYLI